MNQQNTIRSWCITLQNRSLLLSQIAQRVQRQRQFLALQPERGLELGHARLQLQQRHAEALDFLFVQRAAFHPPHRLPLEQLAHEVDDAEHQPRQVALDALWIDGNMVG